MNWIKLAERHFLDLDTGNEAYKTETMEGVSFDGVMGGKFIADPAGAVLLAYLERIAIDGPATLEAWRAEEQAAAEAEVAREATASAADEMAALANAATDCANLLEQMRHLSDSDQLRRAAQMTLLSASASELPHKVTMLVRQVAEGQWGASAKDVEAAQAVVARYPAVFGQPAGVPLSS